MDAEKILLELLKNKLETPQAPTPFKVGEKYYIRTVTHHQTGRVKEIVGKFIVLEQAAWIADSGRWTQAIDDGQLNEVEPIKVPFTVNSETIVDFCPWVHDLPTKQK